MKHLTTIALAAFALNAAAQDKPAPQPLPKCDVPLASIMVSKMQCKAAQCNANRPSEAAAGGLGALLALAAQQNGGGVPPNVSGIADGIKDVLVTALSETGCFEVQDREAMDEIAKELAMAGKKVQAQQADFLVSGAVTQIDVQTDTKSFGGGFIPIIGSISSKTQRAEVALDMRLIDVNTAKLVASRRAAASTESTSTSLGMGGVGVMGGMIGGFGGALSSLKGTNLEAVTKDAIGQSIHFLVATVRQARQTARTQPTAGTPGAVAGAADSSTNLPPAEKPASNEPTAR